MHTFNVAIVVTGFFVMLSNVSVAEEQCRISKLLPNPDAPPRDEKGRIDQAEFLKRFRNERFKFVPIDIVPNNDFGTVRPGDTFGGSWIVTAQSQNVGLNLKTAPWGKAELVCKLPNQPNATLTMKADAGCGCGGTADWYWVVPMSAPPGRHLVKVTWDWPEKTDQKLELDYTVTIMNPNYDKLEDPQIAQLAQQFGREKILVLQEGRQLNGHPYVGCIDQELSIGGYEGDRTSVIYPLHRQIDLGFWSVNDGNAHYGRILIRFDLTEIKNVKVKQAWLKFSLRPGVRYSSKELQGVLPIYPLLKGWKEGVPTLPNYPDRVFVDDRGLGKGYPNVYYQAYPTKWEKPLASGSTDHGPETGQLQGESGLLVNGAKGDVTKIVQEVLAGKLPNHGFLIGQDLPDSLANDHPGKHMEEYKKLCPSGFLPIFSKDEPDDKDFRPRLIIVVE